MITIDPAETMDADLDELLEAIYRVYHYDFRGYARASLHRCVARAQASLGAPTIAHLLDRVVRSAQDFTELLRHLTIQASELFRDPAFFRALRDTVVPHLATYPSVRVWVAGCGMGEEAYSIAILLHEEGLLDRSFIYATDIDAESLRIAASGAYELRRMAGFTESYFRAGGRASLADYHTSGRSHAAFRPLLRERVMFSEHSLATDAAFAEVQLVSCRNVLIYFDREFQDRAIGLFRDSLCPRGFLALGSKETLDFSHHVTLFEPFAADARIYRVK